VEIRVIIPKKARFRHVKQAIARCLGSDDILTRGLLTSKINGVYKAYKDNASVGDVREVTVACADFTLAGGNDLEVILEEADLTLEADTVVEAGAAAGRQVLRPPARAPAASSTSVSRAAQAGAKQGSKGPRITKRQAVSLQRELCEGFRADAFQRQLAELTARYAARPTSTEFQQERQELFLSVQSVVLPKYGFEGTAGGVYRMMGAMGPFVADPEVLRLAGDINSLLGIDSPPEAWASLSKSCQRLEAGEARAARARPASLVSVVSPAARQALAPRGPEEARPAPPRFDRWPVGKYRPFRLFVVGTWNDFSPAEMHWQNGLFLSPVTVGTNGWESFQILKDRSWGATIYPSVPDAGPFEAHTVCGPDAGGHGRNWQIGRYAEEEVAPGAQFAIVATMDKEGAVRLVHWEQLP